MEVHGMIVRHISRRTFLTGASLVGAVLPLGLLAACSGTAGNPAATSSVTTTASVTAALTGASRQTTVVAPSAAATVSGKAQVVSYFVSGDPAFLDAYQTAITTLFNAKTAGEGWQREANVQGSVIPVPSNPMNKLQTMIAGGTAPDVSGIGYEDWVPLVVQGVTLNLDSAIAQHSELNLSDFVPYDIDACQYNGHYYALPRDGGFTELYYNADLFAGSGQQTPTAQAKAGTWDWSHFLVAAQALTKRSGTQTTQHGASTGDWLTWLFSNQADVLNAGGTAASLDTPEAIAALQFVQDLLIKEQVAPTAADLAAQNLNQRFMTGKLAMTFGYRGAMANFKSITGFHWDVAPIPSGKVRMAHGTSGTNFISTQSKYPAAAFSLLAFICSTEGQIYRMGKEGTGMPSRKSVLDSPVYLSYKAPMAASTGIDTVWKDELEAGHAKTVPGTPKWADINTALSKELTRLLDGSKTGKEVGLAMTTAVNGVLKS
jgi:ABC-type glycerol-3-phosphate transport system substrate-binding protein